jgi:hypothetical protein
MPSPFVNRTRGTLKLGPALTGNRDIGCLTSGDHSHGNSLSASLFPPWRLDERAEAGAFRFCEPSSERSALILARLELGGFDLFRTSDSIEEILKVPVFAKAVETAVNFKKYYLE